MAVTSTYTVGDPGNYRVPAANTTWYSSIGSLLRRLTPMLIYKFLFPDSVFSFGAVGDGVADDGPAFNAAFAAVWNDEKRGMVQVPPAKYKIITPLAFTVTQHMVWQWGWNAVGALFQFALGDATKDGFKFTQPATAFEVRNWLFNGGIFVGGVFNLPSASADRDGLSWYVPGNSGGMYNGKWENITCVGFGRDGWRMEGNLFECAMENCYGRDNTRHGASIGCDLTGSVLSAFELNECNFAQNGQVGLDIINNARDIRIKGGYVLTNQLAGLRSPNGMSIIVGNGAENNQRADASFDVADPKAGYEIHNYVLMIGCFGAAGDKQTHLLYTYPIGHVTLIGCSSEQTTGGAPELVYCANAPPDSGEIVIESCGMLSPGSNLDQCKTVVINGNVSPQYFTPATGNTIAVIGRRSRAVIVDHAALIANLTIAMESSLPNPTDGQVFNFSFPRAGVTAIAYTGSATRVNFPTAAAAGDCFSVQYRKTGNTWRRIG